MDKQILKVKSDIAKGDNPKAKKDVSKLLRMDKKQDAKLERLEHRPGTKGGKK